MENKQDKRKTMRNINIVLLIVLVMFELLFGGPRIFQLADQRIMQFLPQKFQTAKLIVSVVLALGAVFAVVVKYFALKWIARKVFDNEMAPKRDIFFVALFQTLITNIIGYFWSYMGIDNTGVTPMIITNVINTLTLFLIPNLFLFFKSKQEKEQISQDMLIKFNMYLLIFAGIATLLNGFIDFNPNKLLGGILRFLRLR